MIPGKKALVQAHLIGRLRGTEFMMPGELSKYNRPFCMLSVIQLDGVATLIAEPPLLKVHQ